MPQPHPIHDGTDGPLPLRRRRLLQTTGAAAGVAIAANAVRPTSPAGAAPATAERRVTLRQGTNTMVAASPDGAWLALDLVVSIWVLPVAGGEARRLTGDLQDATRPAFSPDGGTIAFQSYRDGSYHIWTVRRDGSRLTQHTRGTADHREPAWLPDGSGLVLSSDRGGAGSYGLWRLDLASGRLTALTDSSGEEGEPAVSPDGRRVAFTVGTSNTGGVRVDDVRLDGTGRRTVVAAREGSTVFGPSYSPRGRMAHVRLTGATTTLVVDGEDVTLPEDADICCLPPAWVSDDEVAHVVDGRLIRLAVDGGGANRIPFAATVAVTSTRPEPRRPDLSDPARRRALGIASPVASPDGSRIAFRALNALWVADATGGRPRRVVADGYFSSDPDFTPDGRSLVYASDRAGDADLWRHDLDTGRDVRLTALPGAQTAPRVSPSGRYVAYHDQDGAGFVVDLTDSLARQVHDALFQPGRFSWTPDESTLLLAAVRPYSARFREGTSQLLYVDVASGDLEYVEPMPDRSLSTRGDDGPVVSPDGRRAAFVVESRLYVVALDPATFRPRGAPREVTDEVTDAPVWLDEGTLLTLSNGRLRRHPLRGRARTVPLDLSYAPARTERAQVVRAGALWDGTARTLRRDVDVLVRDGEVRQVRPAGGGRPDVDASDLTVMPGLIDAHNHWHLRGRAWGARQGRLWLSYGITSTRSPGDPAYQMAETREALRAGTLVGPRFFATGEAIDGSRVYYNFMRPTLSATQLRREVERAAGLDYDLVKTYVRLPVVLQRRAVGLVHRLGLRLTSHYLYPAERIGMDGQEHTGATNRLGYSHTVTRLGRSYGDAISLFTASGMSITPTLFNSTVVHVDDPSLVEDRRTRTLFPAWEYQLLLDEVETAAGPAGETTRALLAGNVDMVRRIHDGGGFVIAGTDAPLDNVAISLHANLRAMVGGGMSPYDVLRTATVNPARWLGLEGQLGVVAPGARADLAFVRGNPLEDVDAAAAVERVMVGGRTWTVDELLAAYDDGSEDSGGRAAGAPALVGPEAAPDAREWRLGDHAEGAYWWHEPEWLHRACCED